MKDCNKVIKGRRNCRYCKASCFGRSCWKCYSKKKHLGIHTYKNRERMRRNELGKEECHECTYHPPCRRHGEKEYL